MPAKPRTKKAAPAPAALPQKYALRSKRIAYDLQDPKTHDRAIAEVLGALTAAQGNVSHAAEALEVSRRALAVWIAAESELGRELTEIRKRFGHAQGGGLSRVGVTND